MSGPKAVVVEKEERRDQDEPVPKFNDGVGILWGEHAVGAGDLDEPLVERDAAKPGNRIWNRPEFVVAGNPDDPAELRSQLPEAPLEPFWPGGDVPRQDKPVISKGGKALQRFPVRRMGEMQVRECPQAQRSSVRNNSGARSTRGS